MDTKTLFLAISLCCAVPVKATGPSTSFFDKKIFFGVAGCAIAALLVVTYFKLRTMLSYACNTPIGVIKVGELTEAGDYLKLLQEYSRDPLIKGILLQIDSPGGAAGTA